MTTFPRMNPPYVVPLLTPLAAVDEDAIDEPPIPWRSEPETTPEVFDRSSVLDVE